MNRTRLFSALVLAVSALAPAVRAQLVTTLVDRSGVSLPCVTVGPLAPIAQEYCVRRMIAQGFVLKSQIGASGLTLGTAGPDDGEVTAAAPGSPSIRAGLAIGDRVISVDGVAARRSASSIVQERVFGARGGLLRLALRRGSETLERSFTRGPASEPVGAPKSPNILIGMHPMVNWRGVFMPCMGAGLLGPAAVAVCLNHYRQNGFVRVSDLGSTGLTFDPAGRDAAVVSAVDPGSPAAAADIRVGDQVTAVDGGPLDASLGKSAEALLFGKVGQHHRVVVERQGREVTADLELVKL